MPSLPIPSNNKEQEKQIFVKHVGIRTICVARALQQTLMDFEQISDTWISICEAVILINW